MFFRPSVSSGSGATLEAPDPKRFSGGSVSSSDPFTPPSRPPSRGASEWGGTEVSAPQPGSSAWLRERTQALEAERSSLVRFTLELQALLDQVKSKLRTAPPKRLSGDQDEEIDRWMRDIESLISEKQVFELSVLRIFFFNKCFIYIFSPGTCESHDCAVAAILLHVSW